MAKDRQSVRIDVISKEGGDVGFKKTRGGLESISRQLKRSKQQMLAFYGVFQSSPGHGEPVGIPIGVSILARPIGRALRSRDCTDRGKG